MIRIRKQDKVSGITQLTRDAANTVIKHRAPLGLFFVIHDESTIIGVDNATGDAWTEEFTSLDACIQWLREDSVRKFLSVTFSTKKGLVE